MKKCRERDLAFWKAEAVSWYLVAKKATNETTKSYAQYFLRMSRRICERIESKILVVLLLLILSIGGCGTFDGMSKLADGVRRDVHHITQPTNQEK